MLFSMRKPYPSRARRTASDHTPADGGPVTVMVATPERSYLVPPPPPGFVARPSGRFETTGKYVGDMTSVVAPRGPDFFDQLERNAKTNPACVLRPVDQIGLDDLDNLDKLCDLCVEGRFHLHS